MSKLVAAIIVATAPVETMTFAASVLLLAGTLYLAMSAEGTPPAQATNEPAPAPTTTTADEPEGHPAPAPLRRGAVLIPSADGGLRQPQVMSLAWPSGANA
jgi:hypothetical protein